MWQLLIALVFASAVSRLMFAAETAWPNCTSVVNILAQVPMVHAMTDLWMMMGPL